MNSAVTRFGPHAAATPFDNSTNAYVAETTQLAIEETRFVADRLGAGLTLTIPANRQLLVKNRFTLHGTITIVGRMAIL